MIDKHPNSQRLIDMLHLQKECERLSKRRKRAIAGNFKPDAPLDDKKQEKKTDDIIFTSVEGYFDK